MSGVGGPAVCPGLDAIGVGDVRGVGRPGELGDVLRVILGVVGELPRGLAGTADEQVVAAFGVFDPGEKIAPGSGSQSGSVGRAENLLQRKGFDALGFDGLGFDGLGMQRRYGKRGEQKRCSETHGPRIRL